MVWDQAIRFFAEGENTMKRILVIGCPGAGKSTFARALRDRTGLPLWYLDRIWHRPDRTTVSPQEFDARLEELLAQAVWIIDGNYLRTLEVRLQAADAVFLLDYPTEVCLEGAGSRIGTRREDLPWVEEEFDPEFRQWIEDFGRDQLPEIYRLLEQYRDGRDVYVFHSRQEAADWLRGFDAKAD